MSIRLLELEGFVSICYFPKWSFIDICLSLQKVPEQEITFATFKEILNNPSTDKVQESRRRLLVLNQFRNSKFEDLVNSYQSPVSVVALQCKVQSGTV